MPAVTYFHDFEIGQMQKYLRENDAPLAKLLDEVMELDGKQWFVAVYPPSALLRRKPILYELYVPVHGVDGMFECQVINFPGGKTSINHMAEKPMIETYVYGRIGGLREAAKEKANG